MSEKIRDFYPPNLRDQLLFIFVFCDPVKRFSSHFHHNMRIGVLRKNRNFNDWTREKLIPLPKPDKNNGTRHPMIERGFYDLALERFRVVFPESRFIVIDSEFFLWKSTSNFTTSCRCFLNSVSRLKNVPEGP
eukprot:UN01418